MMRARHTRVHCETDDWSFDPRYTQGRCPICGWVPEGAQSAPRWLALVNRVDWDIVGLFLLADVLVLLALIVAHAAGLMPAQVMASVPSHAGASAASAARTP